MQDVITLVELAYADPATHWSVSGVAGIASRLIPDRLLGLQQKVLKGDINALWVRWFVEAIVEPSGGQEATFAQLYVTASDRLKQLFGDIPSDERRRLACTLVSAVRNNAERRSRAERRVFSVDEKREMLGRYDYEPRCWVCGYKFAELEVRRFLGGGESGEEMRPPLFVDYWVPRGINNRDLRIEIDHVVPVSVGGGDGDSNLRLACGWCNRYKSARLSLYDGATTRKAISHPQLGKTEVPQPFWVVRFLALRGRCEWAEGCSQTTENSMLTVAPRFPRGGPNPVNAWVCCDTHDPIRTYRFVPRSVFAA